MKQNDEKSHSLLKTPPSDLEPTMIKNETLKNYLLDELDEERREHVENLMFSDDEIFQRLSVIDDELVEAYVRGELTSAQSQRLFRRLNASERGRRTLELMVQLAERADSAQAAETQKPAVVTAPWLSQGPSFWQELRELFSGLVAAPRAAMVMTCLLATLATVPILHLNERVDTLQEQKGRLIGQIEELASPRLAGDGQAPIQASYSLRPQVRAAAESQRVSLTLAPATETLELWLDPGGLVTYEEFRARLRARGEELWRHDGLSSTDDPDRGFIIPVKIPTRLIDPGSYELILDGRAEDRYREVARYTFDYSTAP